MSYSQKYTLVHFFTPLQDGAEFHMADWPIHTTLVDVFAIDRFASDIDKKLTEFTSRAQAVKVVAVENSVLGATPLYYWKKLHHCSSFMTVS
jgi:hypothetical protein